MSNNKPIRRVAIIGTGVIGASWTALFLAKGLEVIATDIAPDAESVAETLREGGLAGARATGSRARRITITSHLHGGSSRRPCKTRTSSRRTDPSGSTSRRSCIGSSTSCCRPT